MGVYLKKSSPIFLGLSFLLISCSTTYVEDIKRGASYEYKPGLPELWFEDLQAGYDRNDPEKCFLL